MIIHGTAHFDPFFAIQSREKQLVAILFIFLLVRILHSTEKNTAMQVLLCTAPKYFLSECVIVLPVAKTLLSSPAGNVCAQDEFEERSVTFWASLRFQHFIFH